jgi:hypothetical protein
MTVLSFVTTGILVLPFATSTVRPLKTRPPRCLETSDTNHSNHSMTRRHMMRKTSYRIITKHFFPRDNSPYVTCRYITVSRDIPYLILVPRPSQLTVDLNMNIVTVSLHFIIGGCPDMKCNRPQRICLKQCWYFVSVVTTGSSRVNSVRPSVYFMYVPPGVTVENSTFCPRSVFMCFVWISEQTAIISLYNIK